MTLKEWCDKAGVMPTHPTTERGAVSVAWSGTDQQLLWDICHLSDYALSSRAGVVFWLVPRERNYYGSNYGVSSDADQQAE